MLISEVKISTTKEENKIFLTKSSTFMIPSSTGSAQSMLKVSVDFFLDLRDFWMIKILNLSTTKLRVIILIMYEGRNKSVSVAFLIQDVLRELGLAKSSHS